MLENSGKIKTGFLLLALLLVLFTLQHFGIFGKFYQQHGRSLSFNTKVGNLLALADEAGADGDYPKALELYKDLTHRFLATLGPQHPDYVNLLMRQYKVQFNSQNYDESLPLVWKIYKLHEKTLGPEHESTISFLHELGKNYYIRGKYEKAEKFLKRTYSLRKSRLGQNHKDTVETLFNLANVYRMGRNFEIENPQIFDRILRYYRKVYDVRSQHPEMGEEHKDTLECLVNIGIVLGRQRKFTEAAAIFQKALDIRTRIFGVDHPLTQEAKQGLFLALSNSGKTGEAKKLEDTIQTKDDDLEYDPLFNLAHGRAVALAKKGKTAQAVEIWTQLYEHEILKAEKISTNLVVMLDNLMWLSRVQKDWDQTLKWAKIMIDLAQNNNLKIITKADEEKMVVVRLHAIQAAVIFYSKQNQNEDDELKIDMYSRSASEVIKGHEGSNELFGAFLSTVGSVADFKAEIGKTEDATSLYQFITQNPRKNYDNTHLSAVASLTKIAHKKDDYKMMANIALKFLQSRGKLDGEVRNEEEPKEKEQIRDSVAQYLIQKASALSSTGNYETALALYKTVEKILPQTWTEDHPRKLVLLEGMINSATQLKKFHEALFYLGKIIRVLQNKLDNQLGLKDNVDMEDPERAKLGLMIENFQELENRVKEMWEISNPNSDSNFMNESPTGQDQGQEDADIFMSEANEKDHERIEL